GGDLVETQSAELRQEVPVDRPAVVTRGFLREVRGDRGEVVGDELAEGRRFGGWSLESFGGAAPELGPEAHRVVVGRGVDCRALPVTAGRTGHVHRKV